MIDLLCLEIVLDYIQILQKYNEIYIHCYEFHNN